MPSLLGEKHYEAKFDTSVRGDLLPGTNIEVVREPAGRGEYKHALFDFDGTVSLIREGWQDVMGRMMVDILSQIPSNATDEELKAQSQGFILRTTGMQTIYQMIGLGEEVERLGGVAREPEDYKKRYIGLLSEHIKANLDALRRGATDPEEMLVPGARELLEELRERGVKLCLASGTDAENVKEEAELLGVASCFEDRIYGAIDDHRAFSKAIVIDRILLDNDIEGRNLLGFGDGYVEIDNTKSVGGTAVGVATDESAMTGAVDPLKRERLLGVGADIVVPDFRHCKALATYLMER